MVLVRPLVHDSSPCIKASHATQNPQPLGNEAGHVQSWWQRGNPALLEAQALGGPPWPNSHRTPTCWVPPEAKLCSFSSSKPHFTDKETEGPGLTMLLESGRVRLYTSVAQALPTPHRPAGVLLSGGREATRHHQTGDTGILPTLPNLPQQGHAQVTKSSWKPHKASTSFTPSNTVRWPPGYF